MRLVELTSPPASNDFEFTKCIVLAVLLLKSKLPCIRLEDMYRKPLKAAEHTYSEELSAREILRPSS